jgi:hypothetical protein
LLDNRPGKPLQEYRYRRLAASAGSEASFHDSALSMGEWYCGKQQQTVLRVFWVLLLEWKMEPKRLHELLLIYNQAPAASLNGLAPVQVMTGRAEMSPLDSIAVPGRIEPTAL